MKLNELMQAYPDSTRVRRKPPGNQFTNSGITNLAWARILLTWANPHAVSCGFLVPENMMEDAEADDWEIVDESNNN